MNAFITRLATAAVSATIFGATASAQNTCDNPLNGVIGQNTVILDANAAALPVACAFAGNPISKPGYIRFVPPTTGSYVINNCSTAIDTVMAAMTTCGDAATIVACDDDGCSGGAPFNSSMTFPGTAGQPVFLAVGLWSTTASPPAGGISVSIAPTQPPQPPNTCENPVTGAVGPNVVRLDPAGTALVGACAPMNKPGYVRFVPPSSGTFSAVTCGGTSVDTVVAAMATCGDGSSIIECNDDACGLQSEITFDATQGQPVFIAVALYGGSTVPPSAGITLTISSAQPPSTCDNPVAAVLGDNTVFLDPAGTSLPVDCAFNGNPISKPGYLRFVPPTTGSYVINNCATAIDTVMAAMTTCGDPSTIIACDDDGCTGGEAPFNSSLIFNGTAGQPVFLAVGLWSTTASPPVAGIPVQISESGPPFNPCAPENIGTAVLGTNTVTPDAQYPALNVTGSPCTFEFAPQAIARAKYLRFTANATGTYLFEQCGDSGPNADARMGLLTTCGDASTFLICDDDGCTGGPPDYTSKFQYDLTAGQVVFLVVGGYSNAIAGPFNVLITGPGAGGCQPDLNDDGFVNADDLGILLAQWGPCSGCSADFDQNGFVNGEDLGQMLNAWGACP